MQVVHDVDSWRRMFVTSVSKGPTVRVPLEVRTETQREGELECEGEESTRVIEVEAWRAGVEVDAFNGYN